MLSFMQWFQRRRSVCLTVYASVVLLIHAHIGAHTVSSEPGFALVLSVYAIIMIGAYPLLSLDVRFNMFALGITLISTIVMGARHNAAEPNSVTWIYIAAQSLALVVFSVTGSYIGYGMELGKRRAFLNKIELESGYAQLAHRNEQLLTMAQRDGLTNLFNRRAFDAAFGDMIHRAMAESASVGLIMFDIDWFKLYNDTYGHLAGDDCLKLVARTAVSTVRSSDIVARYGGEEFVVLLYNPKSKAAINKVCENLRNAIGHANITHEKSKYGYVTVSLGGAYFPANALSTPEEMIHLADTALYESKGSGRNAFKVKHGGEELST